jgi:CRISPR-associated protein Cas5h
MDLSRLSRGKVGVCLMRREFVIFDVAGDLAHFRRQYAITTALTYAIPPRTALCGLVGAVLGLAKNDSLIEFGDETIFGLQIIRPVRTGHVSINLVNTKDNRTFRLEGENPRTALRYEVVREPRFRVMFSHPKLGPQLAEALSKGESKYTPCLGLAWMIAWFEGNIRTVMGEMIQGDESVRSFVSAVRSDDVQGTISWNTDGVYQRVRMPAVMQPDRMVTRYELYVIDTTGSPINAILRTYWRLTDGTCFSTM